MKTNIQGNIWEIFLFYHENVYCVYLLESHHRGDSNENTQYNTEKTCLSPDLVL